MYKAQWEIFDPGDALGAEEMKNIREARRLKAAPPQKTAPKPSSEQAAAAATVLQTPLQISKPLTFRRPAP